MTWEKYPVTHHMAANLGTGIQLACRGPTDAYLFECPQATYFADPFVSCTDSTEDVRETRPLQTWSLGRTNVFPVPLTGDMLGDMYLEVSVPAVQDVLGPNLPPWPDVDMTGSVACTASDLPMGMGLDKLDAQPVSGAQIAGRAWRFTWPDGVAWTVQRMGQRVQWTLSGPRGAQECVVQVNTVSLAQQVGKGGAALVTDAGVIVANDFWVDRVALMIMSRARFIVNNVTLHDHERLWYDVSDRMRTTSGHESALADMLGRGASMGASHVFHVPFKFMSCRDGRDPPAFFPLCLVPFADVRVEVDADSLSSLIPRTLQSPTTASTAAWTAKLVSHHYTLSPNERTTIMSSPTTQMVYESSQDMDGQNYIISNDGSCVTQASVTVSMAELSWPCTFLTWVVYDPSGQPFTYVSDALLDATLYFDGVEREHGGYGLFMHMHPWLHNRRYDASRSLYVYSFALDTASRDVCGACTMFNSMRNPTLRLQFSPHAASQALYVKVFASTLNWLNFANGTVTPLFST